MAAVWKRGEAVAETFGEVLRSLREAAGLSLADLAKRMYLSKPAIADLEKGRSRPSVDFATACDEAFGTTPLLVTLVEMDERQGDPMRRRALLASVTATVGSAGLGLNGASMLGEFVRHSILDSAEVVEDWDAVVRDYSTHLLSQSSAKYVEGLQAHLMIARQQNLTLGTSPERLRAMAQLSQLYGLWIGNQGDIASARGWYRTASMVSDRTGDNATRTYVRGRALSRGVYEGATVRETVDGVKSALSITKAATLGELECLSALVHIHGLTENLTAGQGVLEKMLRVADRLPDSEVAAATGDPIERVGIFQNWLQCRIGTRAKADEAYARATLITRNVPQWRAEADVYYARALMRDGDISDSLQLALKSARELGGIRVVGIGVRDVLDAVPVGYSGDDLDELRTYAPRGPVPWETIR